MLYQKIYSKTGRYTKECMLYQKIYSKTGRYTKEWNEKENTSTAICWRITIWSIFIITLLYLSFQFNDTDLYYIIPTGRYILQNGIPYENPFITTAGQNIVIQNWLYCVIVAFIYNHLHSIGLWLLQLIIITAMVTIIFKFFDFKHSENKLMVIIFSLIIIKLFSYINLRPEILTFILIILEILGLEKYITTEKAYWLCLLPLTTLLEINCHASYWIMHFIVILPYCVPTLPAISRSKNTYIKNIKKLILPVFSMIVTLFINPYKVKAIRYVFDALKSGIIKYNEIWEQQPFTMSDIYTYIYVY
jgi:hypothetical protein